MKRSPKDASKKIRRRNGRNRVAKFLERVIDTVAVESTGVYWIPLFEILQERGLEVLLVNARHVKGVQLGDRV